MNEKTERAIVIEPMSFNKCLIAVLLSYGVGGRLGMRVFGVPTRNFWHYFLLLVLPLRLASHSTAADLPSTPWDRYLWQSCRTVDISPAVSNLIAELGTEVQKVLDAGPLAPIRTVYADLEQDPYFMYWQGGRIITTLAMAWPYLTDMQQQSVKKYVRAELADQRRTPWTSNGYVPPDEGTRRELHGFHEARGWDRYWAMWGKRKPNMGSFYGLWLYGNRSRDWEILKPHYAEITDHYLRHVDQCNLYGTMGAHIAMARMARHFGDESTLGLALTNAAADLSSGTNFTTVEAAAEKYWKERYEPRQRNQNYLGWMFLEVSPEIGRYLSENVKGPVLERHAIGLKRFPLFWLREAPYTSRWTGDEGIGIPTELMGMIVPIERWVASAPSAILAHYTRSTPICIGDCYWIEALIHAIESSGRTEWINVEKL